MSKPTNILQFLQEGNKPYSLTDITEHYGKEFGRTEIQKTLNGLLLREQIIEKTFGKQKLYFIAQKGYDLTEIKSELQLLTQTKTLLSSTVTSKQNKIRELEAKLKLSSAMPSLESLDKEKNNMQRLIEQINNKLEDILSKQSRKKESKVSTTDIRKIESRHTNYVSAYQNRKRICNNMLEAILEGYPKSKKQLISDIGLESDEAVGFQISI